MMIDMANTLPSSDKAAVIDMAKFSLRSITRNRKTKVLSLPPVTMSRQSWPWKMRSVSHKRV